MNKFLADHFPHSVHWKGKFPDSLGIELVRLYFKQMNSTLWFWCKNCKIVHINVLPHLAHWNGRLTGWEIIKSLLQI